MTRKEKREHKKEVKIFKELIKVMKHFFPKLLCKFKKVQDLRNKSYIHYGTDEILLSILLGYMLSVGSMRKLSEKFNKDECIENIRQILKNYKVKEVPHYDTINDFLEILDAEELEEIRVYMIKCFIGKRCFDNYRFRGKSWLVVIDATGIFKFDERHCEHCLTKTYNKGTEKEKTVYYHNVLEAKLVIGNMVFSIESEFIENEKEDVEKQDCELNAFSRLSDRLKQRFKRLPICILGDSLYACERVFKICEQYGWDYIIRFKEGSIKSVSAEFNTIRKIESKNMPRDTKEEDNIFTWANEIQYNERMLSLLEMIEDTDEEKITFLWLTNVKVTKRNAEEVAHAGRRRWKIENEGFNIQKNHGYALEHAYSHNYNAMKNHYLICQMAHMIRQLLENGIKCLRELKMSLNEISSELIEAFRTKLLTTEDINELEKRSQIRFT